MHGLSFAVSRQCCKRGNRKSGLTDGMPDTTICQLHQSLDALRGDQNVPEPLTRLSVTIGVRVPTWQSFHSTGDAGEEGVYDCGSAYYDIAGSKR